MKKGLAISPRKDFSPVRLRIKNSGKRTRVVPLFWEDNLIDSDGPVEILHPDMHYGALCSLLQIVPIEVEKAYMQVIRGTADQLQEDLLLKDSKGKENHISFGAAPRYSVKDLVTSAMRFEIGPSRRLSIRVRPQTIIELSLFIPRAQLQQRSRRQAEEQEQHA